MLSREVHNYERNPIGVRSRPAVWSNGIILAAGAATRASEVAPQEAILSCRFQVLDAMASACGCDERSVRTDRANLAH